MLFCHGRTGFLLFHARRLGKFAVTEIKQVLGSCLVVHILHRHQVKPTALCGCGPGLKQVMGANGWPI